MKRIYHKALYFDKNGNTSALCYLRARAINMDTHSWTITDRFVTCKKCLKLLKEKKDMEAKKVNHHVSTN